MEEGKFKANLAFPTIIGTYLWPDVEQLNRDLALELYKLRGEDHEGIQRSNVGGTWHSKTTVLTQCGAPGQQLGKMFYQVFAHLARANGSPAGNQLEMNLAAWAMIYGDRGYSTPHTHPNCHYSGVYYIAGAEEQNPLGSKIAPGTLEFVDPRGGPNSLQVRGIMTNPTFRIPFQPGLMAVFPSWLVHFVHPLYNDKNQDRISVACNGTIVKVTPPKEEKSEDKPAKKPKQREGKKAK